MKVVGIAGLIAAFLLVYPNNIATAQQENQRRNPAENDVLIAKEKGISDTELAIALATRHGIKYDRKINDDDGSIARIFICKVAYEYDYYIPDDCEVIESSDSKKISFKDKKTGITLTPVDYDTYGRGETVPPEDVPSSEHEQTKSFIREEVKVKTPKYTPVDYDPFVKKSKRMDFWLFVFCMYCFSSSTDIASFICNDALNRLRYLPLHNITRSIFSVFATYSLICFFAFPIYGFIVMTWWKPLIGIFIALALTCIITRRTLAGHSLMYIYVILYSVVASTVFFIKGI